MKKLCTPLIILLLILLLSSCGELSKNSMDNNSNSPHEENRIKESSISILNMTDLEIIKRTADYLKSQGETLTFEETEITYYCNETEDVVCKDKNGQDVLYKGDYLEIKYYPHTVTGDTDQSQCLIVFLGEGGKVLGYCKDNISE